MKTEPAHPLRTDWQRRWLGLDVTHPRLQILADAAAQFCRAWVDQADSPRLFFISGLSGTGKTHVATSVASYCRLSRDIALKNQKTFRNQLLSTGEFHWPALADEFREKNLSVLPDLFETDFILLDDVGAEDDPFKIAADKLCQVLTRRARKFTVITSNKRVEDYATIDPRISDRLLRNHSKIMDLKNVPSFAEWQRLRQGKNN